MRMAAAGSVVFSIISQNCKSDSCFLHAQTWEKADVIGYYTPLIVIIVGLVKFAQRCVIVNIIVKLKAPTLFVQVLSFVGVHIKSNRLV